jgi:hypothetical protein
VCSRRQRETIVESRGRPVRRRCRARPTAAAKERRRMREAEGGGRVRVRYWILRMWWLTRISNSGSYIGFPTTTFFIYIFFPRFFKNICPISKFAKLYHWCHMIWHLDPTVIWYDCWGCYNGPTVVSHDVCEPYLGAGTVAPANVIWYGCRGQFILHEHWWR